MAICDNISPVCKYWHHLESVEDRFVSNIRNFSTDWTSSYSVVGDLDELVFHSSLPAPLNPSVMVIGVLLAVSDVCVIVEGRG